METITLAKQIFGPMRWPMVNSRDMFDTRISRFYTVSDRPYRRLGTAGHPKFNLAFRPSSK